MPESHPRRGAMGGKGVPPGIMNQVTSNHLVERARRLFGDAPVKLQVAALPWRMSRAGVEIMLVTSRDTGRWVLPKGGVDKGEELWTGAAREAEEEAGIRGAVSRVEAGRYFYAKVQFIGRATPCEVLVYPLEVKHLADQWQEMDRERRWIPVDKAADLVDEPDLAELIRAFGANAEKYRENVA